MKDNKTYVENSVSLPDPEINFYPQIFDAVVANPPYQLATGGAANVRNVFNEHQEVGNAISKSTSFIYPAMRWVSFSGKGTKEFGSWQLKSTSLKHIVFWHNGRDVFPEVRIKDGVCVVYHGQYDTVANKFSLTSFIGETVMGARPSLNIKKYTDSIDYGLVEPDNEIGTKKQRIVSLDPRVNQVLKKVWKYEQKNGLKTLAETRPSPRSLFGISSDFVQLNKEKAQLIEDNPEANGFKDPVRVFTNNISGVNGRTKWYWIERADIPSNIDKLPLYKLTAKSWNYSGVSEAKEDPGYKIFNPEEGFGRARGALALLATQEEVDLLYDYITSDVIRFLLATPNSINYKTLGANVPLLELGFLKERLEDSHDMDSVLKDEFGITDKEFAFIVDLVSGLGGDYRK